MTKQNKKELHRLIDKIDAKYHSESDGTLLIVSVDGDTDVGTFCNNSSIEGLAAALVSGCRDDENMRESLLIAAHFFIEPKEKEIAYKDQDVVN